MLNNKCFTGWFGWAVITEELLFHISRGRHWPSSKINVWQKANIGQICYCSKHMIYQFNPAVYQCVCCVVCVHCMHVSYMHVCARFSNHSCTFYNPGQWVARKSVRSVTARWEREQPWSSSPSGSVIIWAVLRWAPVAGEARHRHTSADPSTLTWSLQSLFVTNLVNLEVLIHEPSRFSVPKPASQTNQPLTLFSFLHWCLTVVVDPSWNFGHLFCSPPPEQWSTHPVLVLPLPSSFSSHTHNQGASVCPPPSSFGLGLVLTSWVAL